MTVDRSTSQVTAALTNTGKVGVSFAVYPDAILAAVPTPVTVLPFGDTNVAPGPGPQAPRLTRGPLSGRAECGHVDGGRVAGRPVGQRVDRVDVDEAVAFPEGPGGFVGAVAG